MVEDFYTKIIDYIYHNSFHTQKPLLFLIDIYLTILTERTNSYLIDFKSKIYDLIQEFEIDPLFGTDFENYLNKVLEKIFFTIGLLSPEIKRIDKNLFYEESNQKNISSCLNILSILTKNFTYLPSNPAISFSNLRMVFEFWSFLEHEKTYSNLSDENSILTLEYLKKIIDLNLKLNLDIYFIIRHKLYGFERFLNDFILNKHANNFEFIEEDFKCLDCVKDEIKSVDNVYSVLKIMDKIKNLDLRSKLQELFWSIFDELTFKDKLSLIYQIYQLSELKMTISNAVVCLHEDNFSNELTTAINQLSADNFDDNKVT